MSINMNTLAVELKAIGQTDLVSEYFTCKVVGREERAAELYAYFEELMVPDKSPEEEDYSCQSEAAIADSYAVPCGMEEDDGWYSDLY